MAAKSSQWHLIKQPNVNEQNGFHHWQYRNVMGFIYGNDALVCLKAI
jgi:hypothetical protein